MNNGLSHVLDGKKMGTYLGKEVLDLPGPVSLTSREAQPMPHRQCSLGRGLCPHPRTALVTANSIKGRLIFLT